MAVNTTSVGCPLHADDHFGPVIRGCRDDFDFTLYFEQIILNLVPAALTLLLVPFRIGYLLRQASKITQTWNYLLLSRWAVIISVGALEAVAIVRWKKTVEAPATAIPVSTVLLLLWLTIGVLSFFELARSIRPSSIIQTYLAISILLDLAQIRTVWLVKDAQDLRFIYLAICPLKVTLLALESFEKHMLVKPTYKDSPPEAFAGSISRTAFWWLNSLLLRGYRSILVFRDLHSTDEQLSSAYLHQRVSAVWTPNSSLVWTILKLFKLPILSTVLFRLCFSALRFCQPFLINRAVSFAQNGQATEQRRIGGALIGATALLYAGMAIMTAQFQHRTYRAIIMIRGALIALMYEKSLTRPGISEDSAAVTLMSADIDRIATGMEKFDKLWASPIEIGVAIFLLWRQVGLASIVPVVATIVCTLLSSVTGKLATSRQKAWVDASQARVSATASMLYSIKGIKMTGLSDVVAKDLHQKRIEELNRSKPFRWVLTVNNIISNFGLCMASALVFLAYVLISKGKDLDPTLVFTALSLISLLNKPMQELILNVPNFTASLGCYSRIAAFLAEPDYPGVNSDAAVASGNKPERAGLSVEPKSDLNNKAHGTERTLVEIRNASFAYASRPESALKNISLTLKPKSLNILAGAVGSGKSSLLLALLRELECREGSYNILASQIGYCAQNPWLPNTSIKHVIVGPADFDERWYREVVHACLLEEDIQHLPLRDETVIGSKGISLSGGQKQRLALARALYCRPPVLLLDDCFSGLDSRTQIGVTDGLFGARGLCHRFRAAILLVTHSVSSFMFADSVILLNNGTIVTQCKPKDLPPDTLRPLLRLADSQRPDSDRENSKASAYGAKEEAQMQNLARQTGDVRVYAYYIKALSLLFIFAWLFFHVITVFTAEFQIIWLKWWSEDEQSHPGQKTWFYVGIQIMLGVISLLTIAPTVQMLLIVGMPHASTLIHRRLLETTLNATYSFFVATDAGTTLNRFSQDLQLLDMSLPGAFLGVVDASLICLSEAILIFISSKYISATIPLGLTLLYFLQRFYLRTSRQLRLLDLETKAPLYTNFLETSDGVTTLRAFTWQQSWHAKHLQLLDNSQRPMYLLYCVQRWLNFVLDMIVAGYATVVITLVTQIKGGGSSGALGVAMVSILSFSSDLARVIQSWTELETSIGAIARVIDFTTSTKSEHLSHEVERPPSDWPERGRVELRHVAAAYQSDGPPVIHDINIRIRQGEKLGICGRTGSGKSSLLLTFLRMTEIIEGEIFIDDVSLQNLPRQIIRSSITTLPQEPVLFNTSTIRVNLDPASTHPDEAIIAALERVNIWSLVYANGGLDATVDDIRFSQGQKQLFALARALMEKSKVVLLDEITSNVDHDTESLIISIVSEEFQDSTVIAVAHRLQTLVGFDRIVVMDQGRIVEEGTPAEMLQRHDGGIE